MYFRHTILSIISTIFNVTPDVRKTSLKRIDINSTFFVERLTSKGEIVTEHVEAKHLRLINGRMYVCGWCQMLPSFRAVPVQHIVTLADDQTGELVPRNIVEEWLINRSLH